jgi:hypothetical protein
MEKQEEQEKETLQEIHSALNVFQEKLKSIDTDESREEDALELKRLDMRDYILKQKELYKFKENEKTNIDINPNIFHKRQKSSNIAFIPQVVNRSQIIPPKITPSKLIFETPKTEKIISRGEESKINSEEPENNEIEETKEERTNLFEEKEDV